VQRKKKNISIIFVNPPPPEQDFECTPLLIRTCFTSVVFLFLFFFFFRFIFFYTVPPSRRVHVPCNVYVLLAFDVLRAITADERNNKNMINMKYRRRTRAHNATLSHGCADNYWRWIMCCGSYASKRPQHRTTWKRLQRLSARTFRIVFGFPNES
jgi:hypothetical protein